MGKTSIQWTDQTWNPVTGCTKVSQGCKNCYAKTLHDQRHVAFLEGKQVPLCYSTPFETVRFHAERLSIPIKIKKPQKFFTCSMADMFHADVKNKEIEQIFEVMERCNQHTFQVLTKRPDRLFKDSDEHSIYLSNCLANVLEWSPNIWLGVSVENIETKGRMETLKCVPATVRFLSIEPLLEDLGELDLEGIDWVIVGGESGKGAREMKTEWVQNILTQCQDQKVPFFFKQWGGNIPKEKQELFKGKEYKQFPNEKKTFIENS